MIFRNFSPYFLRKFSLKIIGKLWCLLKGIILLNDKSHCFNFFCHQWSHIFYKRETKINEQEKVKKKKRNLRTNNKNRTKEGTVFVFLVEYKCDFSIDKYKTRSSEIRVNSLPQPVFHSVEKLI